MSKDVGVGELVEELEQRGDRLPFEIGAFVALEACEGLLQQSVKLEADDVRVTLEGSVVVSEGAERAEPDEAARSLVSVLARLLIAAGPGVPPYLLQLVKESTTGQNPRDLRRLHDAIEASLIPINRGASRRVLARLVRDSDRPPAPEVPQVDPHELDTELAELLRDPATRTLEEAQAARPMDQGQIEEPITEPIRIPGALARDAELDVQPETVPVPPSRPAIARSSAPVADLKPMSTPDAAAAVATIPQQPSQPGPEPITATIRKWQRPVDEDRESPTVPESAPVAESESVSERAPASAPGTEPVSAPGFATATASVPALETATESAFGSGSVSRAEAIPSVAPARQSAAAPERSYDRPSLPVPEPPARRDGWKVLAFAAALGLGLYALISMGALDTLLQPAAPAAVPAKTGLIDVTVTPSDAQVFVFVGRGPALASELAVDSDHEFIVFDRGLQPSRAVVLKASPWTTTDTGLLYELAIQTEAVAAPSDALDFGTATTEPASTKTGGTGTIRIVTNPLGAKVYRYVGVGPSVRIAAASIHEGQEVLVYHPDHETRRAVIGPSDWQSGEGQESFSASLDIQLPPLPQSTVPETVEN